MRRLTALRRFAERRAAVRGRLTSDRASDQQPVRTLPAREAYQRWAATYMAEPHNPLMHTEQQVMLRALGDVSGLVVLDVGTGPGRYRWLVTTGGAARAIGVDLSLPMLTARAAKASVPRIDSVACADGCALPFGPATFDLVVAGLVIGDVAALDVWLCEMWRVLRPGGRLVYSDFHESWPERGWQRTFDAADGQRYGLPFVARTTTEHRSALLKQGFDDIRITAGALDAARATSTTHVCTVFAARRPLDERTGRRSS